MVEALAKLLGESLLSKDATVKTADALAGKVVILYFSAHWCPPCRGFTPVLAAAYQDYKESGGNEAEVVFCSWDKIHDQFKDYFAEMPWLALPFEGTEDVRKSLGTKFEVNGIPCIVALGQDGERLFEGESVDLRALVSQHKSAAFPMSPEHMKKLEAEEEQRRKDTLKELGSIMPALRSANDEETSFGALFATCEHVVLILGDGDGSDATYGALQKTEKEVNKKSSGSVRTAFIYVGWSLYNDSCDHAPFKDRFYTLQAPELTEDFKKSMSALAGNIGAPHAIIIGRDEAGSATVVGSEPGCRAVLQFGADGYPWSKEARAAAEAEKAKKIADLKEKQKSLQFLKAEGRDGLCSNDGKEVKVDTLAAGGSDAVVGLYFSAHWCPPCRGFTPVLAECYRKLKADGKPFEVVFLSSDRDEDAFKEYFNEMPWLAVPFAERDLKEMLSGLFEVNGIPTLVLLKPDGTVLTEAGREAIDFGAEYFPWGESEMKKGKEEKAKKDAEKKQEAIEAEKSAIQEQRAKGGPVVQRLRGDPGSSWSHDVAERKVELKNFPTVGAPEMVKKSGVLYYEIEVLESQGIPQCGFAAEDFATTDNYTGEGVGDDATSWGFDGVRSARWYDGSNGWDCSWSAGDVIGFAANIDLGKIAVSKNGSWTDGANGVIFENEKIKSGVYPALTGSGYNMRYNLDGTSHGPFKHSPPGDEVWAKSGQ